MNPNTEPPPSPENSPGKPFQARLAPPTYRPSNRVEVQASGKTELFYVPPQLGVLIGVGSSGGRPHHAQRSPGFPSGRAGQWGFCLIVLAASGFAAYSVIFESVPDAHEELMTGEERLLEHTLEAPGLTRPPSHRTAPMSATAQADSGAGGAKVELETAMEATPAQQETGRPPAAASPPALSASLALRAFDPAYPAAAQVIPAQAQQNAPGAILEVEGELDGQKAAAARLPSERQLASSSSGPGMRPGTGAGYAAPASAPGCTEALKAMDLCDIRPR